MVNGFAVTRTHRLTGAPSAGEFYNSLEALRCAVAAAKDSSGELGNPREAMWLTKHLGRGEDVAIVLLGELVPLPVLRGTTAL